MTISLNALIKKYKVERYVSFLIVGDAATGKSKYINDFISLFPELKLKYFDIINEFDKVKNEKNLLEINPVSFLEWILALSSGLNISQTDAVVIDNFDFLFNIWSEPDKKEFVLRIGKQFEKTLCPVPILFILQSDPAIEYFTQSNYIYQFENLETLN